MKLCFITPTSLLEQYASQSDGVHLTLIHLVEQDEKYAEFYRKRSEQGDLIIMDNGTFEFGKPASPERMIAAASKIKAHVLVAPDFPNAPIEKTLNATEEFCRMLYGSPYTVMACPQSLHGDYRGWLKAFKLFTMLPMVSHIGVSILATPNAFGPILGTKRDIELCRLMATYALKDALANNYIRLNGKKIHYLGGGHRVDLLQHYDIADSLDTSSPVWHGFNGITYEHGFLPMGKINKPVDFGAKIEDPHVLDSSLSVDASFVYDCIDHNMGIIKTYAEVASVKQKSFYNS